MATVWISNKGTKGGYVTAVFTGPGAVYLNSLNPLIGANSAGETVTGMNIISAEWSIGNNANWAVSRGANNVLNLAAGQHYIDLSDGRMIDLLGGNAQANVVVTKNGASPGTLILKLHKKSSITPSGSTY